MASPNVPFRRRVPKRKLSRDGYNAAAAMIADLQPGDDLYGFTKGQFSLFELLDAILDKTGPANVVVSTWTAADADMRDAYAFIQCGRISSLRLIVDLSFRSRMPELVGMVEEMFGDSVRVTRTHAKFAMIKNDRWSIVLRTSMNLNQNPRCETFEISDDPSLYAFHEEFVDELFGASVASAGISAPVPEADSVFKSIGNG